MRPLITLIVLSMFAVPAFAWDGPQYWEAPTNEPEGGGGVWGTGGKSDFGISCTHCHKRPASMPTPSVNLQWSFNPPLEMVGGAQAYKPGQRYTVSVSMTGETLGFSNCNGNANNNGFGAAFELANGQRAGRLQSDWGQDSNACPPVLPSYVNSFGYTIPVTDGGTSTYGSCHAIASTSLENTGYRYFFWTAPAAGSGTVTVFWGAVDGNCDMNSQNDDSRSGTFAITEGT
jgi:hypothetical protein